jgi:hypothetical protein
MATNDAISPNGIKPNVTPVAIRPKTASCDSLMTISGYQKLITETQKAANSQHAGRPRVSRIKRILSRLTFQISDPAPLILDCQPERHRRVHCIWFVRLPVVSHQKYASSQWPRSPQKRHQRPAANTMSNLEIGDSSSSIKCTSARLMDCEAAYWLARSRRDLP